jgi:hypothetical protein
MNTIIAANAATPPAAPSRTNSARIASTADSANAIGARRRFGDTLATLWAHGGPDKHGTSLQSLEIGCQSSRQQGLFVAFRPALVVCADQNHHSRVVYLAVGADGCLHDALAAVLAYPDGGAGRCCRREQSRHDPEGCR